ncbi:MAG: FtsQ-type POTRA domain-containing protein [Gammaproteobacteria bacterium]|nr:FtsQ-type POTRA domain-containing protein [Gammaproteobacteria bacterium]
MAQQSGKRRESRNRIKPAARQGGGRRFVLATAVIPLLVGGGLATLYWEAYGPQWLDNIQVQPAPIMVKQVTLTGGRILHVEPERVKALVDQYGKEGMLLLDPEQLRVALEEEQWIYRARVRKVWPDQVELWIKEQQAAARWGERGYLNLSGEFFEKDGEALASVSLPIIEASQQDTVSLYQQLMRFSAILSHPAGNNPIIKMVVDQRGAITLYVEGGLELSLGRRLMEQRLRRWAGQSAVIMGEFSEKVRKVDLRYERGMVLELKSNG